MRHCDKRGTIAPREETHVDWIERVFGFDPDGGNGTLELLIAVALIVAVLVLALRVYSNRRFMKERRAT